MSWLLTKLSGSLTPTSSPILKERERKSSIVELIFEDETDHTLPTEEDYQKFVDEVVLVGKEWNPSYNSNNLNIWTQASKTSSINIVKGNCLWKEDAATVFSLLKDDEFYIKSSADEYFIEWKLVEKFDEDHHISYCKSFKFNFPKMLQILLLVYFLLVIFLL
jgi:hypothetical protein